MNADLLEDSVRKENRLILLAIVAIVAGLAIASIVEIAQLRDSSLQSVGKNQALPPVLLGSKKWIGGLNYLFGNFSSMSMLFSWSSTGSISTQNISYVVLSNPMIKGERTYEVNVTGTSAGNGESDTETLLAWVSSASGEIVQTYDSEDGYLLGQRAAQENSTLFMFTTMSWLTMMNSSTVSQILGSERTITIGKASMYVTSFRGLSSFTAFPDWTANVGAFGPSDVELITSYSFLSGNTQSSMQVLSLTPVQ